jgi:hypothetical protein
MEELDSFLQHYGIRGMRWGKRGSKKKTGVSRSGGALIDRNARTAKTLTDARSGVKYSKSVSMGKKLIGEAQWEKNYQKSMSDIASQNDRVKAGKTTVMDKLDMAVNVSLFERVVSVRPKEY